jgi:hypothetical protein
VNKKTGRIRMLGVNMSELARIVGLVDLLMQRYNSWNTNVPIIPGRTYD